MKENGAGSAVCTSSTTLLVHWLNQHTLTLDL